MDKTHFKYAFPLLLFFGTYTPKCFAQNMSIESANGTNVVIDLTTVQSMTFKNGNMIVSDTDCGDRYFSQFFTTGIEIGEEAFLSENSAQSIMIYPNPVTDQMTISRASTLSTTARIYSVFGELVKELPISSTQNTVSISNLSTGVYFLNLDQQQIKFVKQ